MKHRCPTLALILVTVLMPCAAAQSPKRIPVIVELFTSEGCSSCPPADRFLQKLEKEQPVDGVEIIALQEHVDYWNRLGWTDIFSSPQFTKRQNYYATYLRYTEVFTPNMIIDGTRELRGKDGKKPIVEAAKNAKGNIDLKAERRGEGAVTVTIKITNLPKIPESDNAVVLIAITENDLKSYVSAGENTGSAFRHMAVTRFLKSLGQITGSGEILLVDLPLEKKWKRKNLNVIALVQEVKGRRITAAAKIDLSGTIKQ